MKDTNVLRIALALACAAGLTRVSWGQDQNDQYERPAADAAAADRTDNLIDQLPAAPPRQLSDFQLSAWLIIENSVAARVSQFAAERAQDQRVQQFTQRLADGHQAMINSFRGPLERALTDSLSAQQPGRSDADRFDFDEVLREVSRRIEETSLDNPQRSVAARDAVEPAPPNETRRERRASTRRSGDVERTRDRDIVPDSQLDQTTTDSPLITDTPDNRRFDRTSRAAIRRLLPALRENLPEILDIVAAAVEEADTSGDMNLTGLSFIQFKRQVADQRTEGIQKELGQYQGEAFDQAFLGYAVLSSLEMKQTLEVAQEKASPDLRPAITQSLQAIDSYLQDARRLMTSSAQAARPDERRQN